MLELQSVVTQRCIEDGEIPRVGTLRNRRLHQFKRECVALFDKRCNLAVGTLRSRCLLGVATAPIAVETRPHRHRKSSSSLHGHFTRLAEHAHDVRTVVDLGARVARLERCDHARKRARFDTRFAQRGDERIQSLEIASLSTARERRHRHRVAVEAEEHHHFLGILARGLQAQCPLCEEIIGKRRCFRWRCTKCIVKKRKRKISFVGNSGECDARAARACREARLKCAQPFLTRNRTQENLRLARDKSLHALFGDRLFHFRQERSREHPQWNTQRCGINVVAREQEVDRLFQAEDFLRTLFDGEIAIAECRSGERHRFECCGAKRGIRENRGQPRSNLRARYYVEKCNRTLQCVTTDLNRRFVEQRCFCEEGKRFERELFAFG